MAHRTILKILLVLLLLVAVQVTNCLAFEEPSRPDIDRQLDPEKEQLIQKWSLEPIGDVFGKLQDVSVRTNRQMLHRGIYIAFMGRPYPAVEYALNRIKNSAEEEPEHQAKWALDAYIAKKVLAVFPQAATEQVLGFYEKNDPYVRGKLIIAVGSIAGGTVIRDLLVDALNDQRVCEFEHPETSGPPLRVCDVAYNQLVLRYKIPHVLRAIGPSRSIQTRDYHIAELRKLFP